MAGEEFFEALGGCRDVEEFEKLNRIGEGTYGTVYRARDLKYDRIVALKRVILHNEGIEGFPITAIREIKLLKRIHHPNCVQLFDVVVGRKRSSVFLVFEYCEHDLSLLLKNHGATRHVFKESEAKRILLSVLKALRSLHAQGIIHRDIKLSNILYDRYGTVKLADFGLARERSPIVSDQQLTSKVVTLWYRAPEILLGCKTYTSAVDIWACGCIFGELLLQEPMMPGKNDLDQLQWMFKVLGRATEKIWPDMYSLPNAEHLAFDTSRYTFNRLETMFPDLSANGITLLNSMLAYDPSKRLSADEAINHPYFRERPFPQDEAMMPTFPSPHPEMKDAPTSDQKHRLAQDQRFGSAFDNASKRRKV